MGEGITYKFKAKPYRYSPAEKNSWIFVSLPNEIAIEIRENFKRLEEGWGRMKITAIIGISDWQTSIWFDTKQNTYLLPLKTKIRKEENIVLNKEVEITVII